MNKSPECEFAFGTGCDGGDCDCSCHSEHAPFFLTDEDVKVFHGYPVPEDYLPGGLRYEEPEYDPYEGYGDDPLDWIPWGTPDEWIPDNPDENGMRDSDFV